MSYPKVTLALVLVMGLPCVTACTGSKGAEEDALPSGASNVAGNRGAEESKNQPGDGTQAPHELGAPLPPASYDPVPKAALKEGLIRDAAGQFELWIPPGLAQVNGIVVLNFPLGGYYQEGGEKQLASTWGFAHLTGYAWSNETGTDEARIEQALQELALASQHPEIQTVPIVAVGLSRTVNTGFHLAAKWPGRVIASGMIALGFPKQPDPTMLGIPALAIVGNKDNYDKAEETFRLFRPYSGGTPSAIAINRDEGHSCGDCNQVLWPFLDAVVRKRLASPAAFPTDDAWLGDLKTARAFPTKSYPGIASEAVWLPDGLAARAWTAYVQSTTSAQITSPADKLGYVSDLKAGSVTITATYSGDENDVLKLTDNGREQATMQSEGGGKFSAQIDVTPGLHLFMIERDGVAVSRPSGGLFVRL